MQCNAVFCKAKIGFFLTVTEILGWDWSLGLKHKILGIKALRS